MADNLIFPIGFDLDKAVADASKEWDGTYAAKLENALAKNPVNVKLKFDTKKLDNLDAVKKRLAELKIEPITPETKTAINELASELRTLAKALEQVQKYSVARASASTDAVRASKIHVNEERAKAQSALSAQRAAKAEENLAAARLKDARAANTHATATRNANKAFGEQSTYLDRLVKRIAVYWSVRQVGNFLRNVRDVTAQFELQRVSLGAIIQDQQRANQLFSEIKSFAVKSPVSVLDLTKYTKQLAAYKIGVDELFETTKKLTDVSVGLGVAMDRVVLAYGQTRATGYLRASEIRQFTEMGVPIVEELAKKLEKMNGELVTAADVMDMVSKRGISFELVKDVFDDMTSAGGMFYNMQEKQGNTLYGMWAKLGDAASIMYDEIGNTGVVSQVMRTFISGLTDVMKHWRSWSDLLIRVSGLYLANAGAMKLLRLSTLRYTAAGAAQIAASKAKVSAAQKEVYATRNASAAAKLGARMDLMAASAKLKAATATNILSKSFYALKAAILANPIGWLITIVGSAIAIFSDFSSTLDDLEANLSEINEKYTLKNLTDADNFNRLADGALKAANGSKEQREKLEELDRTYGEILGSENLQIDKLRELKGEYGSLTETIKEYNTQMKYSEREGEIKSFYGEKKKDAFKEFEEEMSTIHHGNEEIGHEVGSTIALNIQSALLEELEKNGKATIENAWNLIKKESEKVFLSRGFSATKASKLSEDLAFRLSKETADYVSVLNSEREALNNNSKEYEEAGGKLGKLRKEIEETKKAIENTPYIYNESGKAVDEDSFLYQQMVANLTMKKAADLIRNSNEMKEAFGDKAKELEKEWLHWVDKILPEDAVNTTSINFDALLKIVDDKYPGLKLRIKKIQEEWGNVVPTDSKIQLAQKKGYQIIKDAGGNIDKMSRLLMKSGEDWSTYVSRIKDEMESEKRKLKELRIEREKTAKWGLLSRLINPVSDKDIKDSEERLDLFTKFYKEFKEFDTKDEQKGKGKKDDQRISILQEMVSTIKQVNKEYDDLAKKEGNVKALSDTQRMYAGTFKNMQALAKQYKFALPNFGVPTDTASLAKYLEAIKDAMAKLPKSDKAVLSLQVDIAKLETDAKQKQIEEELKRLAEQVSRTKTAKEFYDKILSQTGDIDLAASVTMSIYGDTGEGLFESIAKQIRDTFKSGDVSVDLEIGAAIDSAIDVDNKRINYGELAKIYEKYQDKIIEKNRSTAENIVKEGQKTAAYNIETWEKELAKAKDYEEQRTDIINRETQRRAEIIKSYDYTPEQKEEKLKLSRKKQEEDLAKVNFEEFTKSEDYIKIFENLDNTATSSLKRLRKELQALIATNKDLPPENMKALVKALEDIDQQISGRSFGNDMVQSVKDFISATKNLKIAKQELVEAQAEYEAQEPQLNADIDAAKEEEIAAQQALNNLKNNELATDSQITAAQLRLNDATQKVAEAEQKKAKAVDKVNKAEKKITGEQDKQEKATSKFMKGLEKVGQDAEKLAGLLGDVKDLLGISEDSAAGLVFDSAISSLQTMSKAINVASTAQAIFNTIANANPLVAAASAAIAIGSAIANWIRGNKIRKANKEIERQQDLLDQLDYTYGRLENAADKAFGTDYVNNYNQQINNLQAQQEAYLKQAEAERSKGKKKDKDKIKEYEEQARETADKIKEKQEELVAHFTGSSKTDIARQMAKSWIDARASMSDTFAAIKGDYADMIKNMIVEGAAARVIENALTPVWYSMEKMLAKNDVQGAIDSLIGGMDTALNAANNGMEVLWKALEARGYDMKKMLGTSDAEMTGIKREIATASEESITGLAAAINTQNYYISHVPTISENVAAIRALMEVGGATGVVAPTTGWTDWQQQAMDNYNAIARNTADTVIECRRAANACENAVTKISRAMKTKGATVGFNTFINS